MAGATVATWVKVRTKNGLKSMPISLKDGGGNFIKGQTITESELREVLKKKGDRIGQDLSFLPSKAETKSERQKISEDKKKKKEDILREKSLKSTELLKSQLDPFHPSDRPSYVSEWISRNAKDVGVVNVHGMKTDEKHLAVYVDGIKYSFESGNPKALAAASGTIADVIYGKIPKNLSKHTTDIYFTSQKNKVDGFWSTIYGEKFVSSATGGDGRIVVYGGKSVKVDTIAHEMGHNLAKSVYGQTSVPETSKFMKIVKEGKESAPSEYGKSSPSEDFAESVSYYVTAPSNFSKYHPQRYNIVKNAIETGVE